MDENLKRQHIASLNLFADALQQDVNTSVSDKLLRPLLTDTEYIQYKECRRNYAASWVEPPQLPDEASQYWRRCIETIKICARTRCEESRKAASKLSEQTAEQFCQLPFDEQEYFIELTPEQWRKKFPRVEHSFHVPLHYKQERPFTGTAKNAAQQQAVRTALERLKGEQEAGPASLEFKAGLVRPSDD